MRIIRRSHSSCSAVLFTTGFLPIGIKLLGTWNVGSCFFSLAGSSTCLKLWQRPFLPIPTTLYQLLQFIPFEALKTRPDSDQFLQVKKPTAVGLPTRLLTVFPSGAKHCILELGNPPSASLLPPAIQPTSPSDCPDPSTP